MKRYSPFAVLILTSLFLSTTGFQCGSAEVTTARLAIQQGQFEKAEQSLVKEVQKNDKNEEAWFLLGQVRWEMKKFARRRPGRYPLSPSTRSSPCLSCVPPEGRRAARTGNRSKRLERIIPP